MSDFFPILAIETSGEICSAALMLSENVYAEYNIMQKNIHSEKLLPAIESLFGDMNLNADSLKTVAVSIGPGSFTGLRIGMSAAKGIALGIDAKICPVPTFDAAALKLSEIFNEGDSFKVVMNTNIEEAYYSLFEVREGKSRRVGDTKLVLKKELEKMLSENDIVFGNVKFVEGIRNLEFNSINVARWAYFFGKDLLISNFDLLEPNYFKNFIARIKK